MLISGTMLYLILAFEKGHYVKNWPIALVSIIGAISISVGFSIVWIFTSGKLIMCAEINKVL